MFVCVCADSPSASPQQESVALFLPTGHKDSYVRICVLLNIQKYA